MTSRLAICLAFSVVLASSAFAANGKDDMDFEPEEVAQSGPPSKTLERALKLYEKGDYYSTSIELYKVINGETQDSDSNKQRAEFFLGKTMYQMKFYAASLSFFDNIVQKGAAHRYYSNTLKWLAALAKVLPESAGILEKIGKYTREDLEKPELDSVRSELYFLLGRHYYREGNLDQAVELFALVPRESEFYINAKFLEGVTHVRKYEGAPAIEAFKEILTINEEPELRKLYNKQELRKMVELSWMSMGRVFYSTKQFDASIKYFERLPQESEYWLESLFDSSWAYFTKKSYSKALGNIHTLTAPYFENEFFPESVVLKAVMYYYYCRYDRAEEALAEFNTTYLPLRDELNKIVAKTPDDNSAFYAYVKKLRGGDSDLDDKTERLARTALEDKELEKTFAYVDELDREVKQHDKADRAWKTTAVAGQVLQELSVQKSLAESEAGRLARERLDRLAKELTGLRGDALKVKYEIAQAKIGQKRAEMQKEEVFGVNKAEAIQVDDEHQTWNFNGEYWKDELGFYRFKISSRCKKQ